MVLGEVDSHSLTYLKFTKIRPNPERIFGRMLLLQSSNCSHQYPGQKPIRWPDFALKSGVILGFRGPSGCGKSTALHTAGGLLPLHSGTLELRNIAVLKPGIRVPNVWRQKGVGWIPQRPFFWPGFTVRRNLELAAWAKHTALDVGVWDLLDRLGLADCVDHRADRLSLGQQQRLSTVRATVGNPKILLADEPTASLDDAQAKEVMTVLRTWCETSGGGILLASHDSRTMVFQSEGVDFVNLGNDYEQPHAS